MPTLPVLCAVWFAVAAMAQQPAATPPAKTWAERLAALDDSHTDWSLLRDLADKAAADADAARPALAAALRALAHTAARLRGRRPRAVVNARCPAR